MRSVFLFPIVLAACGGADEATIEQDLAKITAASVSYDHTAGPLAATNVQQAIDELAVRPGVPGPQGPQGDPGPQGPVGPSAQVTLASLENQTCGIGVYGYRTRWLSADVFGAGRGAMTLYCARPEPELERVGALPGEGFYQLVQFGVPCEHETVTRVVRLRNLGQTAVSLSNLRLDVGTDVAIVATTCETPIEFGQTCTITLSYTANAGANANDVLHYDLSTPVFGGLTSLTTSGNTRIPELCP